VASRGEHPHDGAHENEDGADRATGVASPHDRRRRALPVLLVLVAVCLLAGLGTARGSGLDSVSADADESTLGASGNASSNREPDADLFAPMPPEEAARPSGAPTHRDAGRDMSRGTSTSTTAAAGSVPAETTAPTPPPQDEDAPSVVARPVPAPTPDEPPPSAPPPPWAGTTFTTPGGHVSTAVGCVPYGSSYPGADELDAFFAARIGPVIGWDYQHVYPLGGDRYLWLFQDAFVDHSGGAVTLGQSAFAHNVALLQEDGCFRLLHRGSTARPEPFETGTGSRTLSTWFWPMGGEMHDGLLHVFWVQMVKDGFDPSPPDGLGWHPAETWVATYDPTTLARTDFRRAANPGVSPVYGYAVASETWPARAAIGADATRRRGSTSHGCRAVG
jgi:hypothetical protein